MGGDWFAERRGSGTTRQNNPGQRGVTSDPACMDERRNQTNQPSIPVNGCCRKKQDEGEQSLPTGTGNRPRRGRRETYQITAVRPMHVEEHAAKQS